jgi:hypothetical protein
MKEYIKKFADASAADNYAIADIPFTTSIATTPVQNLVCNESRKKLINTSGVVTVVSAGPEPPTMVDLGLSVKWADANLGATNADTVESWYGDYYAWGETETKEEYSWSNYEHCNGERTKLTKYCPTEKEASYWGGTGSADNKLVLDSVDDAPRVQLDSPYRMPTKAECEELLDTEKIDNVWINNYDPTKSEHTPSDDGGISGLNGRLFTSKVEGHIGAKIFIPAAGNFNRSTRYDDGSSGYVWSASLNSDGPGGGWYIYFYSDDIGMYYDHRCIGQSVRCVSTD